MSSKIDGVPRELLERLHEIICGDGHHEEGELGNLLDAPVVERHPLAASHPDHPAMSRDELLAHAGKISHAIEACGSSPELTTAVTLASDLSFHLHRYLDALQVDLKAIPDKDPICKAVVALCDSIPGSTTWNAAEFAYDAVIEKIKEPNS